MRYANAQFLQISVAGADATQAYGINDCGIVVGTYVSGGSQHGFYGRPGALQTLDLPGVADTKVQGVNNAGRVVGFYVDAGGVEHGFVTDAVPAASCSSTGESRRCRRRPQGFAGVDSRRLYFRSTARLLLRQK